MLELLNWGFDLLSQHLTDKYVVATYTILGLAVIGALITLTRGARLIPFVSAVTGLGLGIAGGGMVAQQFAWSYWPSMLVLAAVGLALGALLHRFWLAVMLAGCCATVALGVYSGNVFPQHYDAWYEGAGMDQGADIYMLPETPGDSTQGSFWNYLIDNVPNMRLFMAAVGISAGLAGLVFGLLLPTLSRALVASTVGTLTLIVATGSILHMANRAHWMQEAESWTWIVVAGVWSASLLYNLLDERRRHAPTKILIEKRDGEGADDAKAATA